MSNEKIGIIGLGLVGTAVSERLTDSDFTVIGYDVNPDRTKSIQIGSSPGEIFSNCERVILCLPTSRIVIDVINESRDYLRSGQTIIDTGTGSIDEMFKVHEILNQDEVSYIEASIAGSSELLRNKKATLFTAGDSSVIKNQDDLFSTLTDKSFYLGEFGNATKFKLVHNLIIGLNRAALAEGLQFAQSIGIEPKKALKVLKETPAASGVMETKGHRMANRNYEPPQALISQHLKDVKLILSESKKSNAIVPLSHLHRELLDTLESRGFGKFDNSAIVEAFISEN